MKCFSVTNVFGHFWNNFVFKKRTFWLLYWKHVSGSSKIFWVIKYFWTFWNVSVPKMFEFRVYFLCIKWVYLLGRIFSYILRISTFCNKENHNNHILYFWNYFAFYDIFLEVFDQSFFLHYRFFEWHKTLFHFKTYLFLFKKEKCQRYFRRLWNVALFEEITCSFYKHEMFLQLTFRATVPLRL